MSQQPMPKERRLTTSDIEAIRERLDEEMLANPAVAHIVREDPLSARYKRGLMRRIK